MATCRRCPATTTATHGLCPDCVAAASAASRTTQGLPAVVPADDDIWARIDILTRRR